MGSLARLAWRAKSVRCATVHETFPLTSDGRTRS